MKAKAISAAILFFMILCGFTLAEWTEPVPIMEVNTEYAEWTPFLSFDGLSLYFSRGHSPAFYDFRIYEATRQVPYGPFTSVGEISGTLNSSPGNVLSPWISPDNLRMYYFTESNLVYKLMVTERPSENGSWPIGSNIPGLEALGGRPQSPSLTADELIIVFSSYNAPGGIGGFDLWMATRPNKNSSFENVRNLTEINTAYKESKPYISPDGLTLYFPTDRNGLGQLFKATRASLNQPFGNLENLPFFDAPRGGGHPSLSSDGMALYMAKTISGVEDIYVSYWIVDPYQDAVNAILDAIAKKLDTLDRINAALEKEWAAYDALQELLDSGDYGDLNKGDIITAMQKVYSSIQHQELTIKALDRSIEKLEDSLAALSWGLPKPVSHWKFDEGKGSKAHDFAGNNHGTIYGATWTTGQVGGALSFDGVDDYVDIPFDSSLDINASQGISVSVWMKLNSLPDGWNQGPIFGLFDSTGAGTKNYLFIDKPLYGNQITWDQYPPSFGWIKSVKPDLDTWYHIAVVEDSTKRAIYINGSLDALDNTLETYEGNTPDTIRIGNRADSIPFYFDGTIDEVIVYDVALSDQEIELLYNNILVGR